MIIDFHTHIFSPNVVKNRNNYFDDHIFSLLYSAGKSRIADHQNLLNAMNESGIDYAVAMGFPWSKGKYCEEQNRYLKNASEESKGRIIPFGILPLDNLNEIMGHAEQIKELGLAGIGETGFYADGLDNKTSAILEKVFSAGEKLSLPVCLHVNEPVGHHYTGKHCTDLTTIYSIIQDFPELVVILSHWGGGLLFYELMKEVRASLKNVYYDTAASPFLYNDIIYEIAIKIFGSEKILFGSDYPLINFGRYIESIEDSVKGKKDRENILGKNAAEILKINI